MESETTTATESESRGPTNNDPVDPDTKESPKIKADKVNNGPKSKKDKGN